MPCQDQTGVKGEYCVPGENKRRRTRFVGVGRLDLMGNLRPGGGRNTVHCEGPGRRVRARAGSTITINYNLSALSPALVRWTHKAILAIGERRGNRRRPERRIKCIDLFDLPGPRHGAVE